MTIMFNIAGLRPPAVIARAAEVDDHAPDFAPNGDRVISPSQVSTFLMCPRKWAARYLHGQHEPVAEGTHAGKRMHALLEEYYKTGTVPSNASPEGTWALALIRETGLPLPNPGAAMPVAERKFKFEYEGVWWRGSKDLTYMRDGLYVIRDHKSTSELNPLWMKTDDKLLTDPQSVIYALEAFLTDDPEEVENEWGYVTRTKYPKTALPHARMTWDHTRDAMEALTCAGLEMLKHYRERPELNALPPTGTETGGCEAFRGCKVNGCNVSALDRIKGQQLFNARKQGGVIDMTELSFVERIRQRQALQGALTTPATEATTPPPAESAPPVDIRTRLAAATGAGAAVMPEPFTPPAQVTTPATPATTAPAPVPGVPTPGDAPRRGRGRAKAVTPPQAPTADIVQAMTQSVAPSAPPATVTPPATVAALTRSTYATGITAAAQDGYVLCINCAPIGDPSVILFSQYATEIHKALKEAKGWDHYGLYGFEGKGAFQDALQQYIQQSPPVGYLVLWTSTDEGRDALSILERYAVGRPFRGV